MENASISSGGVGDGGGMANASENSDGGGIVKASAGNGDGDSSGI